MMSNIRLRLNRICKFQLRLSNVLFLEYEGDPCVIRRTFVTEAENNFLGYPQRHYDDVHLLSHSGAKYEIIA